MCLKAIEEKQKLVNLVDEFIDINLHYARAVAN